MWGLINDCYNRLLAINIDSSDSSYTPQKVTVEGGVNLTQMSVLTNVSDQICEVWVPGTRYYACICVLVMCNICVLNKYRDINDHAYSELYIDIYRGYE